MKKLAFSLILLIFTTGCSLLQTGETRPRIAYPAPVVTKTTAKNYDLPSNVTRHEKIYSDGRVVSLLLIKADPNWTWNMKNEPSAPKTVQAWREKLGAKLVINGSYFNEQMLPTGFYQSEDTTSSRIAWPNTDDKFSYTGAVSVNNDKLNLYYLPTASFGPPIPGDRIFLSYPTLVMANHNAIESDSQKFAARTALLTQTDGTNYIAVTESGALSLYELAELLLEKIPDIRLAVNLDGGSSTGLSYHDGDTTLDIVNAPVPNVVYVR